MRTNHIDICKFETADDDGYKVVKSKIVELMQGNTKIQEQAVSYDSFSLIVAPF